jgi:hypothetical protein
MALIEVDKARSMNLAQGSLAHPEGISRAKPLPG